MWKYILEFGSWNPKKDNNYDWKVAKENRSSPIVVMIIYLYFDWLHIHSANERNWSGVKFSVLYFKLVAAAHFPLYIVRWRSPYRQIIGNNECVQIQIHTLIMMDLNGRAAQAFVRSIQHIRHEHKIHQ